MNQVQQTLAALRGHMAQHGLDAWIVPSADPHLSEYLPEHWQARRYLSGFTGSVGTLVVCRDTAGLWVDSRYWEQAAAQLAGSGITLQKAGEVPPYHEWLAQHLPEGARAGAAADMLSLSGKRQLEAAFAAKKMTLHLDGDLNSAVWPQRPPLPQETVYPHDAAYVSESAADKIRRVRAAMLAQEADYHFISSLDDIAWLTNLRGSDVSFNPVFLSFLLLSAGDAVLYVDEGKLNPAARQALAAAAVRTRPYAAAAADLAGVSGSLLIEPNKTAVSTLNRLPDTVRLVENINPSTLFKAQKSAADLAHIRQAMAYDGAALCAFFADFEQKLADGVRLTEIDIDEMLLNERAKQPGFISPSFDTIAGFNANGALPHYRATPEAHSVIKGDGLLLIDSGGQYLGGTTDITRVVPVGQPSAAQIRDFTLVLKAHIALAETVFPEGILAPMLDAVCRKPLWQAQCNYGHGTGHGVGYFLNVHEGPQVIAYTAQPNPNHAMREGMITSNEPGLYRPGQWGIRIENLVAARKVEAPQETAFGSYLYFEDLTLCPIDTRLIERALLTESETAWLNAYHAKVREALLPLTDGAARDWLLARTEAV
ncbi:aminopeptidase P family protein [Neisseria leonii]|uniref:aminopeptidase P family protein n=1 Tax=Neisseria leonii TaxID=2995413 RepID=UPI00237AF83C|nr:aminopeptidase P family protein [Neisseria sp. 3986]MDD9326551.1 aminopeptidase P family protein [Neisseria sp. 3986]